MKKIFNYMIAAAALLGVALSCVEGPLGYEVDEGTVVLEAYGPNPVLRGNDLTFIGQNLDKVTSVVLPVDVEIPASSFKEVTPNSFKVTVPIEAEAGAITIYYEGGKIVPVTTLSYAEPFYLNELIADETVVQGDSVTVKGDYLNNIALIGFSGAKVTVPSEEFGTWNRYQITFAIPRGAASGKVYVADANGNQVFSETDINVLQPTVAAVSPADVRPGDVVTIAGTLLDQIDVVKFTGGSDITEFKSVAADKLQVEVPWNVQDGVITLTSAAGESLTTTNAITVKVPASLKVEAESVYKSGLNVVITGTDIDLVTGVSFANGVAQEDFTNAEGKITTAIPATAVDGVITLSTASGKTVTTPEITLVKPTLTGLGATEIVAGNTFTVAGTDLDLVTEVTLAGDKVDFDLDSEEQLTVTTTATNKTGKVTIKTANGTTVESESELTVTYDSFIVVNTLTSSVSVGDEVTMTGSNFNMIESIYLGEIKVTGYSKRADDEMIFTVPTTVETGTYNLRFVLTTGDEEMCALPVEVKGAITTVVIWEGSHDLGNWSSNLEILAENFAKVPYGAELHLEYIINESTTEPWYQIKPNDKLNWNGLQSVIDAFGSDVISCQPGTTHVSFVLNDSDLDVIATAGAAFGGHLVVITKVYATYESTDADPIFPSDIMINDFDQHGDHNATWDSSWAGYATGIMDGDNGYLEVTSLGSGWLINCNHQSSGQLSPIVDDTSKYNVKLDIYIPEGATIADNSVVAQLIFCGGWYWIGPLKTGDIQGKGKWMTWTIDYSGAGVPASLDMSSGDQGLAIESSGTPLPVGTKIDNFRLSLK